MPYGAPPPGWYPPPGSGYPPPPPGQFAPHQQMPPFGNPGPQSGQQGQGGPPRGAPPQAVEVEVSTSGTNLQKPAVNLPSAPTTTQTPKSNTTTPAPTTQKTAPPPPVESKPDVAAALAPPAPTQAPGVSKNAPAGPRSGRIIPAIPFTSPGAKSSPQPVTKSAVAPTQTSTTEKNQFDLAQSGQAAANAALQYQNAAQAATAAVAAAMAKLPPMGGQSQKPPGDGDAIDNLTKKVNEMRTDDRIRHSRQPGTGGYAAGHRGAGRGGRSRGGREQQGKSLEVPTTDFDFESSNAQFNKQDLSKEAIATESPAETPTEGGSANPSNGESINNATADVVIPGAGVGMYNKSSFFDNISSEAKDREDTTDGKRGGMEFRSEERRRNLETFGLGSVDGGYRGGFRGRGRGRSGFRGGYGRGIGPRGGFRGGRSNEEGAVAAAQYASGI